MVTLERKEWGNLYGYLSGIRENDAVVSQTSINGDNYDEEGRVWDSA
jgi:ABC-type phosphate transport system auxiliary subunit